MRKILFCAATALSLVIYSCGGNDTKTTQPTLNEQEQKAVENQVNKDQAAMDSLERALQAEINGTDSSSK